MALDGATSWTLKARALSSALEEALRSGHASTRTQGCVDRAYAAWSLDSVSAPTIARVAHLARRAHEAIRSTSRASLEAAYTDGARVLHMGLPSAIRRRIPLEVAVDLVRNMRREADSWIAVVETTMRLVGGPTPPVPVRPRPSAKRSKSIRPKAHATKGSRQIVRN